jgi:hypothetical protein
MWWGLWGRIAPPVQEANVADNSRAAKGGQLTRHGHAAPTNLPEARINDLINQSMPSLSPERASSASEGYASMAAIDNLQNGSVLRAYAELRQSAPVSGEAEESRFHRGLLVGLGLSGVLYAGLGTMLWALVN